MRKKGPLGRREAQYLARRIKRAIKEDRKHRVKWAGNAIMVALEEGIEGRLGISWGRGITRRPASSSSLATPPWKSRRMRRKDLYSYKSSPGEHIPASRDRVYLQDEAATPTCRLRT